MNEQNDKTVEQLMKLRNDVFKGSDSELALALGRPTDEVQGWQKGEEIDEDAEMKIVNLAQERLKDQ
jgi:hypothetical protein